MTEGPGRATRARDATRATDATCKTRATGTGEQPPPRARLFVALELPPTAQEALERWRAPLRAAGGLRLVDRHALHVTLCFLGSRPAADIGPISAALDVVARYEVVELAPAGALWLPRRRPNVLAVRLEDHGGALARVQAALSEALAGGGWYTPERRAFLPHVTVARVRRGRGDMATSLPHPPDGFTEHTFAARAVTLFRSRLSPAGAAYETLASVALGGGTAAPRFSHL